MEDVAAPAAAVVAEDLAEVVFQEEELVDAVVHGVAHEEASVVAVVVAEDSQEVAVEVSAVEEDIKTAKCPRSDPTFYDGPRAVRHFLRYRCEKSDIDTMFITGVRRLQGL